MKKKPTKAQRERLDSGDSRAAERKLYAQNQTIEPGGRAMILRDGYVGVRRCCGEQRIWGERGRGRNRTGRGRGV